VPGCVLRDRAFTFEKGMIEMLENMVLGAVTTLAVGYGIMWLIEVSDIAGRIYAAMMMALMMIVPMAIMVWLMAWLRQS
jgi:hypothetical protein